MAIMFILILKWLKERRTGNIVHERDNIYEFTIL